MTTHSSPLIAMTDTDGKIVARLEYQTGRVYTLDGKYEYTLEQHGPSGRDPYPENGDALMSQFAAGLDVKKRGRAIGKELQLKDAGRRGEVKVLMDLSPGNVHIPSALPNVAFGYRLQEGVADIALPVIPVAKNQDYYFTWDLANAFEPVVATMGAPGAPVNEVNPTLSNSEYTTLEYALGGFVTTEVEANADAPLRPYQATVTRVHSALRMNRERRVATALNNTAAGGWNANNVLALSSGQQWNAGVSSNPINNLHFIIQRSYEPVTKIIMGGPVFMALQENSAIRQYYFAKAGNDTVLPTPDKMAEVFGLPPIVVADMRYTSAAGLNTYVWPSAAGSSSSCVLLHEPSQNPPADGEEIATGYTFRWTGASAPDGTVTGGFLVRSYYDPKRGGRGGRMIVIVHNDAEVMTSGYVGGLITGVVQ